MLWVILGLFTFIFQIAIILIAEFRHPSKSIAWLMVLFMLPIIGFVIYYFMAKEYKRRLKMRRTDRELKKAGVDRFIPHSHIVRQIHELHNPNIHKELRLFGLLQHIPNSPITMCNETKLYTNGNELFELMFRALRNARHHIHMEYYILRADQIGQALKHLLITKAKEGVEVRLLYDGIGSYHLSDAYLRDLEQAGVECRVFLPPSIAFFDKRMNYRNHRKITVIDGQLGFLGGFNIGDEYLGRDSSVGYWRDTHIQLKGDAVYFLQRTFLMDWAFVSRQYLFHRSELFPEHDSGGHEHIQIIASGPDNQMDTILNVFFSAISAAKQRIYITSPYFIPDHSIFIALKTAAISGVDVRILIPMVPDSKLVHYASLSYLEELMQAGVRFYRYTKGFIHAKTLVVDQMLATVGTANMDMRSFFSNFELNALIFDTHTIDQLELDFLSDLKESEEVHYNDFVKRSRFQKSKEVLARLLSPLL